VTLHQFEIFAAIAKYHNLTRASQELRTSQPAMSHQMKQLQESYGVKLYSRTPRGVELTDAGKKLLLGVRPILAQVERLKTIISKKTQSQDAKVLTIVGTYAASVSLLPSLIALFRKTHGNIEIDYKVANLSEIERVLIKGEAEVGVTGTYPRSSRLAAEPYRNEKLVFLVANNHRLGHKRIISLEDLQAVPLVLPSPNGGIGTIEKKLRALEEEKGLKFIVALRCDAPQMAKEAIARKVGLGIIYEEVAKDDIKSGKFLPLKVTDFNLEGQTYITYHRDRRLTEPAKEFLDLLRRSRPKGFRKQFPVLTQREYQYPVMVMLGLATSCMW
jgi:DNA-binding transcriptional LysR family regulator